MGHWAKIEDNQVVQVVVADDDKHDWLVEALGGQWVQTSYNTSGGVHYDPETGEPSEDQSKSLRFNYAGIGFTYDEERDAFISPKPSEDATLDEATCTWIVPEVVENV
jgi:hypothetical protein